MSVLAEAERLLNIVQARKNEFGDVYQPSDPLFIDAFTHDHLLETLNIDPYFAGLEEDLVEDENHPKALANYIAGYYGLGDNSGKRKGFWHETSEWLGQNFNEAGEESRNSATMGIAVVTKAYDLQDETFIQKLEEADSETIRQAFKEAGSDFFTRKHNFLEGKKIYSKVMIPSSQIFLLDVLGKFSRYTPDYSATMDGAKAMFNVVQRLSGREPKRCYSIGY